MAEEENSAVEFDSLKENSKEWASSFTVDGVQYAASVFWESLQNVDAPFLDAKEAAENVMVGADLFCVKHGKSPQLGLAASSQGFKKGMNVAAVTAVTSMSDASSLLAGFSIRLSLIINESGIFISGISPSVLGSVRHPAIADAAAVSGLTR